MNHLGTALSQEIAVAAKPGGSAGLHGKGHLHQRITYEADEDGVSIFAPDYITFITEGTKPHEIKPKEKMALAWGRYYGLSDTGKPKFRTPPIGHPVKGVHHPGTDPNPFIDEIIEKRFDEILAKAIQESFR